MVYAFAAADLDNDGAKEALISSNFGQVQIEAGSNHGAPPTVLGVPGGTVTSLAVGDLDGDSKPDLVAITGSIYVFYNRTTTAGQFKFSAPEVLPTSFFSSLHLVDLNQDGRLDICVGLGQITVWVNLVGTSGSPTFSSTIINIPGAYVDGLSNGDVNGDGRQDIVLISRIMKKVYLGVNQTPVGSSSVVMTQWIELLDTSPWSDKLPLDSTFHTSVCATMTQDLDGDGRPDLVVAPADGNHLILLRNLTTSGGSIHLAAPLATRVGYRPIQLLAADLDGDGKREILVLHREASSIGVLKNNGLDTNGDLAFGTPIFYGTGYSSAFLALEPGLTPSATTLLVGGGEGVFRNRNRSLPGLPSLSGPRVYPVVFEGTGVAAADLNGDGLVDLAVGSGSDQQVALLANRGLDASGFPRFDQFTQAMGRRVDALALADLNGDGKADLLIADEGSQILQIRYNISVTGSAPSFGSPSEIPWPVPTNVGGGGGYCIKLIVADLNQDGLPDLVVTSVYDYSITLFLNTGTRTNPGPFLPTRIDVSETAPYGVLQDCQAYSRPTDPNRVHLVTKGYVLLNTTAVGSYTPQFQKVAGPEWVGSGFSMAPVRFPDRDEVDFVIGRTNPIIQISRTLQLSPTAPTYANFQTVPLNPVANRLSAIGDAVQVFHSTDSSHQDVALFTDRGQLHILRNLTNGAFSTDEIQEIPIVIPVTQARSSRFLCLPFCQPVRDDVLVVGRGGISMTHRE
ncbi:MAG: VCBS repeat-containing protein [Holophagaceae bacterium]|nr:VCBS repeat-containing protein [Holophagaceae bacterium]